MSELRKTATSDRLDNTYPGGGSTVEKPQTLVTRRYVARGMYAVWSFLVGTPDSRLRVV
jgi:hypothetical protein